VRNILEVIVRHGEGVISATSLMGSNTENESALRLGREDFFSDTLSVFQFFLSWKVSH
jgi:hypothetical protein